MLSEFCSRGAKLKVVPFPLEGPAVLGETVPAVGAIYEPRSHGVLLKVTDDEAPA